MSAQVIVCAFLPHLTALSSEFQLWRGQGQGWKRAHPAAGWGRCSSQYHLLCPTTLRYVACILHWARSGGPRGIPTGKVVKQTMFSKTEEMEIKIVEASRLPTVSKFCSHSKTASVKLIHLCTFSVHRYAFALYLSTGLLWRLGADGVESGQVQAVYW